MSLPSAPAPSAPLQYYAPPPPPPGYVYQTPYASMTARFGAMLLDFLILLFVSAVILLPFGLLAAAADIAGGPAVPFVSLLFGPLTFVMFALWILYFSYFESTSGQTPGKKAAGIRVVSMATGQPPDLGHALVRNVLRLLDWLPALYLLGFVVAFSTSRKQRIGDLVADTLVLRA